MSIPADVLERTGYRLPTAAEWEYACRAGAVTSRYYGHSPGLLDGYAWYENNSQDHAWACGSLRPNDLGLFDMLGNTIEWFHDNSSASRTGNHGLYNDVINTSQLVNDEDRLCWRRGEQSSSRPGPLGEAFQSPCQRSVCKMSACVLSGLAANRPGPNLADRVHATFTRWCARRPKAQASRVEDEPRGRLRIVPADR